MLITALRLYRLFKGIKKKPISLKVVKLQQTSLLEHLSVKISRVQLNVYTYETKSHLSTMALPVADTDISDNNQMQNGTHFTNKDVVKSECFMSRK
ncbi:CLUMA_CG006424, isoform A [Clunio marinus]|uniref:CLUMA_CG006424, isoform A n=1 Tax=Clunio marinus TaxID=568069 RepID=A0A1J1HXW3_9DIPT|nr:CLUMA_CG006424, isoform A [Clunio marinus]